MCYNLILLRRNLWWHVVTVLRKLANGDTLGEDRASYVNFLQMPGEWAKWPLLILLELLVIMVDIRGVIFIEESGGGHLRRQTLLVLLLIYKCVRLGWSI